MIKEDEKTVLRNAKETALRFLSYRQRSRAELRKKLAQKGFNSPVIEEVLFDLEESGFINDREFANMWLRARTIDKPSGRNKIFFELLNKGVEKSTIEQVLQAYSHEAEAELAAELIQKKMRRGGSDPKKIAGFLLRRGFPPELIYQMLEINS